MGIRVLQKHLRGISATGSTEQRNPAVSITSEPVELETNDSSASFSFIDDYLAV
jgi:hypothetical protein